MWLVLSRRPGETIKIGEHVEVCVLKLLDGRVNIGISAPKDVAILRGELKLPRPTNGKKRTMARQF